ncbi:hypothetical protein F0562_001447 [Nyssa sinensis]|uniref:Homeobox domain-containing protein n=1 Tax=Nyssa sinensis TaxID=561372 RepID=A0A5J5C2A3_9ASTE|nr:hypothetical protein F0562_001447 [Nyssa sinensis]
MSPAASSRWYPTPEQLMILEEMYRGGIRTPNASQIQQIAAHLSFYGKIEGKNVFYWFQNHKARDRQKLRRKLSKQLHQQQQQQEQLYLQQQHHNDQQNFHNHLLHYPEPPAYSSTIHQLSHYTSARFLPQGGVEDTSAQMMSYTWKLDLPEMGKMDKSMSRTYGRDWMMMTDVGPTTSCCNRPIKTLELFPITATSLKEECTPSPSKHISCSTSTN